MLDVRKNPNSLANATLAYGGATRSNVKFLLAENEQMEKNLQASTQEEEQLREHRTISIMSKMRKVILIEVSTLETTMRKIYDGFVTVHKAVFDVHVLQ